MENLKIIEEQVTVSDELDSLRSAFPDCQTVAFADLSSRMILKTSSAQKTPQELMDRLCEEAVSIFGDIGSNLSLSDDTDAAQAVVFTSTSLKIFLRGAQEPADILCCVCSPSIDVDSFLRHAQPALDRISQGPSAA
ncbi:hypothetical protein [Actibacterium sp. 188UL27-1]|uniref:hypothetical protein n=1 Tax=Actibacterium sp. 188UL27-1 TaxID=2786961 RepID=UPI00195655F7|nr:hypothetical protein [Actibacterium sp. 188UL27-1]MBM7067981.1 hypothetical protein [Actibacterium sp. 188UL27-1]